MRACTNGDETDAFTPASKHHLVWNHGARGKIKRRYRRKARRSTRQLLRSGQVA